MSLTHIGGPWTASEQEYHINYLELMAAFQVLGFQLLQPKHSAVLDSKVAISFINKKGGSHSKSLSQLAILLWEWCLRRGLTIHAEHIPGIPNYMADAESRKPVEGSDWKLDPPIFRKLLRLATIPSYQLSTVFFRTQRPRDSMHSLRSGWAL